VIEIPEKALYLLKWETKAFAFLALTLKDGSPHVTPIWFDWDGAHIIINTARGRVKDKVLRRRPKVALALAAPGDLYTYLQIRGQVDTENEEGGHEQICKLNEKYHGKYEFPRRPGQVRVTYTILPEQARFEE
jgi:PPOX class probable F420-dependent enzyme